ncbi:AfsR/SARP family transcriptional regulator [Nocardia iowensis]|uniref:Winged helix-turn-helix domain-containing protein n=1 Tax=Nocardia iowensis TaxID=204891 RepID=A0ABX8RZ12_NOCIO|nr:BTAD domain-containing putative transcriptional regulator [Nocardia iowensis]QXN94084.1 winged helix-turn-helix domain-containing protein [Nocardia iowensis]
MFVSTLGRLQVNVDDDEITPTAPKLRSLLAVLAVRRNRIVPTGVLLEELWDEEAPISALATLQTYVYQLRKLLQAHGANGRDVLRTHPLGYEIRLADHELDIAVFEQLAQRARDQLADGAVAEALLSASKASALCTGTPLYDICAGPILEPEINRLRESLLQVTQLRVEARMRLGHDRDLIAELKLLCGEHPYHEGLHGNLMTCLHRCGRRSEALEVYHLLRSNLSAELGIEPSSAIQELQRGLLDGAIESPGADDVRNTVAPAQLPRDLSDFSGRAEETERLTELFTNEGAATAVVVTVTGGPGVGKSALAIHAGHKARSCFPDGQFYADLRENGGGPSGILGRFLRAVGFSADRLPDDLDERAELFRSWAAGRRVLIVLDNVTARAQIRQLLAGGPGSAVLITGSFHAVAGLEGAVPFELDAPDAYQSRQILSSIIGAQRVAVESDAAERVIAYCDRIPLALRIVGAKLLTHRLLSLSTLADRLSDPRRRLQQLQFLDWNMGQSVAASYRELDAPARALLDAAVAAGLSSLTMLRAEQLCAVEQVCADTAVEQLIQVGLVRCDWGVGGVDSFDIPELVACHVSSLISPNIEARYVGALSGPTIEAC